MRVCHVWDRFLPIDIGGLERYILGLSYYLAKKKDIEFSLITGRLKVSHITRNIGKFEDAGFLKVYRLGPSPSDLINSVLFPRHSSTPKFVEKANISSLCYEAQRCEIAKSADVFHIHGIWKDLKFVDVGIHLSRHFHKPLVLTLHGGFVGDPLQGGMPLESPEVKSILVNDVAQITTYSKEVLSALEGMGLGYKSHLITNFVDTWRFKNPEPLSQHDVTIIYVGRLEPVQTPQIVLQAFKQVHEQFPNAKLHIVGYGTLFDYLQNLIKEYGLENSASMMGKQTDVRKFLWNSDIFVATNFGYIATLEAMSAGLAIIAPNFGILKETISHGNNGLLVEEHDVNQITSALISLVKDDEYRRKLAFNASESAKSFDIREVAPQMVDIYKLVTKS